MRQSDFVPDDKQNAIQNNDEHREVSIPSGFLGIILDSKPITNTGTFQNLGYAFIYSLRPMQGIGRGM